MISRRTFLGGLTASVMAPRLAAAEPPPETNKIRFSMTLAMCEAPLYIIRDLMTAEGFATVEYVKPDIVDPTAGKPLEKLLSTGEIDIGLNFAAPVVMRIDGGDAITVLGGVHAGCFELFATERVRAVRDLKGKTVAVGPPKSAQHVFVASMVAYIGLDPQKDVRFVSHSRPDAMRLLSEGKVDAYLGFPPDPQELRANKIGHVVVNSAVDRPWSQYFCCMVVANREFVARHPVATKRALRAILKGDEVCALDPARAARAYRDRGFDVPEPLVLQALKDVPFGRWRAYDPADTLRFYALRLHEAGMIQASPQKILAQGTDWRFLNELKKELKG